MKHTIIDASQLELEEQVVAIKRVTKVVKGGRNMRFAALVVVGDKNGHVGAGIGKAAEIPEAIRKGKEDAIKSLVEVPINENGSIPHDWTGVFGSASVLLKTSPEGTGIIAGGPARKVLELAGYNRMLSRMITYIPQNSVVGMLLEHREKYVVIRSMQEGLMQHDVYSWEVLGPSLIHEDGITDECRVLNASLKEWIDNMDYDQRRQFVNSLFDLLDECDAKTTDDLQNNWYKDIGRILTSIKKMDEASRKVVSQTILSLLKITKKNVTNKEN